MSRKMATEAETLEFCNKVRAAGGGDALGALFESDPGDQMTCLIANGLNFDCCVRPVEDMPDSTSREQLMRDAKLVGEPWEMICPSREVRDKIAAALGLVKIDREEGGDGAWEPLEEDERFSVVLPDEITLVAETFDDATCDVESASSWPAKYLPADDREVIECDMGIVPGTGELVPEEEEPA